MEGRPPGLCEPPRYKAGPHQYTINDATMRLCGADHPASRHSIAAGSRSHSVPPHGAFRSERRTAISAVAADGSCIMQARPGDGFTQIHIGILTEHDLWPFVLIVIPIPRRRAFFSGRRFSCVKAAITWWHLLRAFGRYYRRPTVGIWRRLSAARHSGRRRQGLFRQRDGGPTTFPGPRRHQDVSSPSHLRLSTAAYFDSHRAALSRSGS